MTKLCKQLFLAASMLFFSLLPIFTPSVSAQATTQAQKNTVQLQKALSLFPGERAALSDFRVYVRSFYLFSIGASILVAVMLMMIGGVIWLTSAGNQSRVSKAQEYITNSIIGVLLLLGSYSIIQAINPRLVQLDDPNLPKIPAFGSCIYQADGTQKCRLATKSECTDEYKGTIDPKERACADKSLCQAYNPSTFICKRSITDGVLKNESGNDCKTKTAQLSVTISKEEANKEGGNILQDAFQALLFDDQTDPLFLAENRMQASCIQLCSGLRTSKEGGKCTGTITSTASNGTSAKGFDYTSTCKCNEL